MRPRSPSAERRSRVRRRAGRVVAGLLAIAVVAVAAFAAAVVPKILAPQADEPRAADVVLVIGPPNPTRRELAERLLDDGVADTVVFSVPATGPQSAAELPDCNGELGHPVACMTPEPFTTQGEARMLAALAAEHGWDSAIVITWTPHIERTRLLMERCFPGDLMVVEDPVPLTTEQWAHQVLYQSGAWVKALATPVC